MEKIFLVQVLNKPAVYLNDFIDLNTFISDLEVGVPCQILVVERAFKPVDE